MPVELIPRADLRIVDPESVKLRGYAAIFGNVFKQSSFWGTTRYKVLPGAFDGALERLGDKPLEVFWNHNSQHIQIGETTERKVDARGFYFEATPFVTAESLDVLGAINGRANKRIGASFSFDFGEVIEDDDGVEVIHSFTAIHELGPTTWGANPLAYAELVPRDAADETKPAAEPTPATEGDIIPADAEAMAMAAALWRATANLRSPRHA